MSQTTKTTANWMEIIKRQQYYNSGDWFDANDICSAMGLERTRTLEVLNDMYQQAQLDRMSARTGKSGSYKYRKASSREWIAKPWRKRSNAQLGITEPVQFGAAV